MNSLLNLIKLKIIHARFQNVSKNKKMSNIKHSNCSINVRSIRIKVPITIFFSHSKNIFTWIHCNKKQWKISEIFHSMLIKYLKYKLYKISFWLMSYLKISNLYLSTISEFIHFLIKITPQENCWSEVITSFLQMTSFTLLMQNIIFHFW